MDEHDCWRWGVAHGSGRSGQAGQDALIVVV